MKLAKPWVRQFVDSPTIEGESAKESDELGQGGGETLWMKRDTAEDTVYEEKCDRYGDNMMRTIAIYSDERRPDSSQPKARLAMQASGAGGRRLRFATRSVSPKKVIRSA